MTPAVRSAVRQPRPCEPSARHRRRRDCDTDSGEDYRLIEDSDAKHGQDDTVVRPPRRKRRRMSTSTITTGRTTAHQQTHLYCADSRSWQKDGTSENLRPRSLSERPSSTQHALPPSLAFPADEVEFFEQLKGGKYQKGIRGDEFEVEEILDSRRRGRRLEYLIKWGGYGHEHNSWGPMAHLKNCREQLQHFHKRDPYRI
ncbi:hypothetical protein DL765_011304 [Monosporascus sp. GIB2]|nr:hypothetical protein DL765_011304 [Monosporascus sp. GIB2]